MERMKLLFGCSNYSGFWPYTTRLQSSASILRCWMLKNLHWNIPMDPRIVQILQSPISQIHLFLSWHSTALSRENIFKNPSSHGFLKQFSHVLALLIFGPVSNRPLKMLFHNVDISCFLHKPLAEDYVLTRLALCVEIFSECSAGESVINCHVVTKCALKFQISTRFEDIKGLQDDWAGAIDEASTVDIIKLLSKGPWIEIGIMDFESAVPRNVLRF